MKPDDVTGKSFGGKEIEGVGKVHGADCCRLQLLQAPLHSAGAAGSAAPGIVAMPGARTHEGAGGGAEEARTASSCPGRRDKSVCRIGAGKWSGDARASAWVGCMYPVGLQLTLVVIVAAETL